MVGAIGLRLAKWQFNVGAMRQIPWP